MAWLDLGEHREVSVYGSPAAMRRLAAAVVAVAAAAERLPVQTREPVDGSARAVARS